jgi:UDP-N-acetylglucosamine 1-carboxyvinyltransferase
MYKISYSPNLKGEIAISGSKNAALPVVAANYILDNAITLHNKPHISDIRNMEALAETSLTTSKSYFDLTNDLAKKFRASILLIPLGLLKYGEVRFVGSGGCNIGKRPLDTFEDALTKAGITISYEGEYKIFRKTGMPKRNIMLQEFSVTAVEALITYLAFLKELDYEVHIYQVATEPHVKNLIAFLNNAGANIVLGIDHTIIIHPVSTLHIKNHEFEIVSDYIEAGTYFAIGAGADNTELTISNINVDDLSAMYNVAEKIGINFRILDKHTIKVNSYNKGNYKAIKKLEIRIFPGFPSDLQSIFGCLLTQCHGISKIFETLYEGRFGYLSELENLGAKIEILNPHQALVLGATKLKGGYVSSTDLRGGSAMVLAGIMAQGTTFITNEAIIERGYDHIVKKLCQIGVQIEQINKEE